MKKLVISAAVAALGIVCIACGVVFTPQFIGARLSDDGVVAAGYLPLIANYRMFAAAGGLLLLCGAALFFIFEKRIVPWVSGNLRFDDEGGSAVGAELDLFLISFAGLFFEIMMIRWVASEFRIFAFFKNLILMSSLVGLGVGFSLAREKVNHFRLFPILVSIFSIIINVGSQKLFLLINYPGTGEEHIWSINNTMSHSITTVLFYGSLIFIFFFNMALFVGPGQLTGRLMGKLKPLRAYSVNVVASLLGIGFFSLLSALSLPPVWWFCAGFAVVAWFFRKSPAWGAVNAVFVAIAILFFLQNSRLDVVWSPYYKIQTMPFEAYDSAGKPHNAGLSHFVNGSGFINTIDMRKKPYPDYLARYDLKYNLPYRIKKAETVLIVGSGTGNNAAAAIRNGAKYVDAVEIDPGIVRIGKERHPEKPYTNPGVHVYVNDARNFFHKTDKKYDMVVFGLLDSHTLFSSMSSVRLDNFVYTLESIREVKSLLKPDGVLALDFAIGKPWIGERMAQMLTEVFGREPLSTMYGVFITGPGVDFKKWADSPEFKNPIYHSGKAAPATDNWPYLYLSKPQIPQAYIMPLLLILGLCAALVLRISPEARHPKWRFFFLGSGFLLVEFKSMTEAALLFGSTWIVNSAVIAGILVMALCANAYISKKNEPNEKLFYLLLFAALALNYFVPVKEFLGDSGYLLKSAVCGLFLALPMLFAGMIFASSLKKTNRVELAFSSNMLGAMLGGLMEYSSLALGISQLYAVAAVFYLLSFVFKENG